MGFDFVVRASFEKRCGSQFRVESFAFAHEGKQLSVKQARVLRPRSCYFQGDKSGRSLRHAATKGAQRRANEIAPLYV